MIEVGSLVCINTAGINSGEIDVDGQPFDLGRWSYQKRSEVLAVEEDTLLLRHIETGKKYRLSKTYASVSTLATNQEIGNWNENAGSSPVRGSII